VISNVYYIFFEWFVTLWDLINLKENTCKLENMTSNVAYTGKQIHKRRKKEII
jgi:hypothetical protein